MRRYRSPYPAEFRREIVELVRAGRTPSELAKEFEPSVTAIKKWVRQANCDDGLTEGLTTDEKEELRRLRREVEQLRIDREILGKAAAWFARETDSQNSSS